MAYSNDFGEQLGLMMLDAYGFTNKGSKQQKNNVEQATRPAIDPMSQINPYYTQQQPMDSLAPMLMYQNYLQTGQVPAQQSGFQPWNNPAQSVQSAPASPVASPIKTGGK